jgi:hypothetical protein
MPLVATVNGVVLASCAEVAGLIIIAAAALAAAETTIAIIAGIVAFFAAVSLVLHLRLRSACQAVAVESTQRPRGAPLSLNAPLIELVRKDSITVNPLANDQSEAAETPKGVSSSSSAATGSTNGARGSVSASRPRGGFGSSASMRSARGSELARTDSTIPRVVASRGQPLSVSATPAQSAQRDPVSPPSELLLLDTDQLHSRPTTPRLLAIPPNSGMDAASPLAASIPVLMMGHDHADGSPKLSDVSGTFDRTPAEALALRDAWQTRCSAASIVMTALFVALAAVTTAVSGTPYFLTFVLLAASQPLSPWAVGSRIGPAAAWLCCSGIIWLVASCLIAVYGDHEWIHSPSDDTDKTTAARTVTIVIAAGVSVLSPVIRLAATHVRSAELHDHARDLQALQACLQLAVSADDMGEAWQQLSNVSDAALAMAAAKLLDAVEESMAYVPMPAVNTPSRRSLKALGDTHGDAMFTPRHQSINVHPLTRTSSNLTHEDLHRGGSSMSHHTGRPDSRSGMRMSASSMSPGHGHVTTPSPRLMTGQPSHHESGYFVMVVIEGDAHGASEAAIVTERLYSIAECAVRTAGGTLLPGFAEDVLIMFHAADPAKAAHAALRCATDVAQVAAMEHLAVRIAVSMGPGTVSRFGTTLRTVRVTGYPVTVARLMMRLTTAAYPTVRGIVCDGAVAAEGLYSHLLLPIDVMRIPASAAGTVPNGDSFAATIIYRVANPLALGPCAHDGEWLYQLERISSSIPPSVWEYRKAFIEFAAGRLESAASLFSRFTNEFAAEAVLMSKRCAELSAVTSPYEMTDGSRPSSAMVEVALAIGVPPQRVKVAANVVRQQRNTW